MRLDILARIAAWDRTRVISASLLLTAAIAVCDRFVTGDVSIGILYIFPLAVLAVFLSRWQICVLACGMALLREQFGPDPWAADGSARVAMGVVAFTSLGLLITEVVRSRRIQAETIRELKKTSDLRQKAESDARALIESSSAAVITIEPDGAIYMTNRAARRLLGLESESAASASIVDYFPVLDRLIKSKICVAAATMIEGNGRRRSGEMFYAQIWLSSYQSAAGTRLAAVVADASEQFRDREELGLRQLLTNSKIIAAAVSHEIRNIAAAADALYQNIGGSCELAENADFEALGALLQAMRKVASAEVSANAEQVLAGVDLNVLLSEFKIILSSTVSEANVELTWEVADDLPRVRADHSGLLQVLLNLTQNSVRALEGCPEARISIAAYRLNQSIIVRVSDSGPGIAIPEALFQPLQAGATSLGLGLYVSRALIRTYGGELQYVRRASEQGFVMELPTTPIGVFANA